MAFSSSSRFGRIAKTAQDIMKARLLERENEFLSTVEFGGFQSVISLGSASNDGESSAHYVRVCARDLRLCDALKNSERTINNET